MNRQWMEQALCKDNIDLWWNNDTCREAIHQCLVHCPVLFRCREMAFRLRLPTSVMGGIRWTSVSHSSIVGRPSLRYRPMACYQCRMDTRNPCGYCGEEVSADEKVYTSHQVAHFGCREEYSRELRNKSLLKGQPSETV